MNRTEGVFTASSWSIADPSRPLACFFGPETAVGLPHE